MPSNRSLGWLGLLVLLLLAFPAVVFSLGVPSVTAEGISCTLSATVNINAATFSGSISGGMQPYTWSLDYGDGTTAFGQSATFSGIHDYAVGGTYTAMLTVHDVVGLPGSCSVDVTTHTLLTLNLEEPVPLVDAQTSIPALRLNESFAIPDEVLAGLGVFVNDGISAVDNAVISPSRFLNETLSIIDRIPQAFGNLFNESAVVNEQVSISQPAGAPGGVPGGLLGEVLIGGAIATVVAALVVWRFLLVRPK